MKTTVEEIINDFNKELEVAISIANNDKIKTIKHLINIASNYLEKEKEQLCTFASDYVETQCGASFDGSISVDITTEEYYNLTFKSEE
jgi:hypothetical protein